MKENQRREFLKKGLAGIAGAAFLPGPLKSSAGVSTGKAAAPALPSRTLGRTGLQTPLLSLGCGEASGVGLIKKAYDSGVKLFFSATYYGRGNNERLVGEAFKGLYCQQCKQCLPQCPHNLDIPTLMRSYMYAYGYRNLEHARDTLDSARVSGRPCDKCDICSVACASGFDIKDRVQDIIRLGAVPTEFLKA
ncbi:MAG: hypothetical protein PHI34_09955 [Acidobacteriota bacterium]|nr:hypothetical protein [Acidobacteriota bacterium]